MNNWVWLVGGALMLGWMMRRGGASGGDNGWMQRGDNSWTMPLPTWEQYTADAPLANRWDPNRGVY